MSGIEFEVWGKRQSDLVAKNLSQMNLFYIYDLLAARGTHFQFYKVLKKLVNFYKSECDMHTRSDTMKPKFFEFKFDDTPDFEKLNWDSEQGRDLATSGHNKQKFQLDQSYSYHRRKVWYLWL